jgi:hypothetical protein
MIEHLDRRTTRPRLGQHIEVSHSFRDRIAHCHRLG